MCFDERARWGDWIDPPDFDAREPGCAVLLFTFSPLPFLPPSSQPIPNEKARSLVRSALYPWASMGSTR